MVNNAKVLIAQGSVNGVSVYDLELDSLRVYDYETKLLPAEKPGNYSRKVGTIEEFKEAMSARSMEPYFGDFMFDKETGFYYRVSFLKEAKPDGKVEWKGVLSIFDESLNLIHEEAGLGNIGGHKFMRNGSIYRFININDEMAFELLKPIFDYD